MSYPALKNLGINRPHEISSYSLLTNDDVDTLRVRYTRQKGSLLPTARKYKFPRRPMVGVDGQAQTEISPALEAALSELSKLLSDQIDTRDRKAELLNELTEFENYVSSRVAEFKAEIEKL